jgi:hypothetical protein
LGNNLVVSKYFIYLGLNIRFLPKLTPMKLISKLLLLCLSLLTSKAIFSQAEAEFSNFNQAHEDHLVCGLSKDVILEHSTPPLKILSDYPSSAQFDCGKFKVFYADLLPGAPAGGFADPALGATRRSTLCAVLNYVESVFDLSNVPDNSIRIEVEPSWIMSLNQAPTSVDYFAYGGPMYIAAAPNTIMGGVVYDFINTGIDPALNSDFHAYLKVNFSTVGTSPTPISWLNNHTDPVTYCQLDLFYVLLHEVGHMLGFASLANNDGDFFPNSFSGNNNFSRLDYQLYHSDDLTTDNLQKFIIGSPTNAMFNPLLNSGVISDNGFWVNGSQQSGNHPIYSGTYYNPLLIPIAAPSVLSHLDEQQLSYSVRGRNAPGYAENYVMGPFGIPGSIRRNFTDAEIKIFLAIGYLLNPTYTNTNLNNLSPYSEKVGSDVNYPNSFDFGTLQMYAETVNADQTIANNIGVSLTFNLWQDISINDPEGGPLTVADGTLTNIRGCGNGGNNHDQLTLSADKKSITFTPRPNFIGRAQFAFRLFDGVKVGSWHFYTIDVQTGNNVNYPVGSNLLINGNLEEGTEVRRTGSEINKAYTTRGENGMREGFMRGYHYSDANPYNSVGNPWGPAGAGDFIRNSLLDCSYSYPGNSGSRTNGFPFNPGWGNVPPDPNLNVGDRYRIIYDSYNYLGLGSPLQTCHKYILKFDYTNSEVLYMLNIPNYQITFGFTNNPTHPVLPVLVNTFSINLPQVAIGSWSHQEITFNYCASSPSNFLDIISNFNESLFGFFIDNVEIVEVTNFNPLTVSIDGTSGICIGGSTTLTATIADAFCNPTYLWSNGMTTSSITVSPSATETYSVTVSDGCITQTVSQEVTVSAIPVIQNMADLTFCEKTEVPSIPIVSNPTGPTIDWTNSNTAIGVPATGTGDFPSFTATNDDLNGNAIFSTVTVTPTLNGCVGSTVSFTITINNEPILDPILDQEFCSNSIADVNDFSTIPAGSTYTWTSSNASIGLATSGSGNIPLFNAINATTGPITSTINVTPTINGCVGEEVSFLVTIKPTPKIDAVSNQTLCANSPTSAINFTGTSGATYNWVNSNSTIGLAASGTGNIPSFTATNSSSVPSVASISATATVNGCTSNSANFTITVNPNPLLNTVSNQTLCANTATVPVVFSSTPPSSIYSWTNSNTSIGLAAGGSGNIPSFTAINSTTAPIIGIISVKAKVNGCISNTINFTITVNPLPIITVTPPSSTITPGLSANLVASGALSYSWSPASGLSCTNCPNPAASPNTTTNYTVTGTNANGCSSSTTAQVIVEQIVSCSVCPNTLGSNLTSNQLPNRTYCVNSNVNIFGNVLFRTSEFKMASNVTIFVQPGALLTIQGCHLYSCGAMWKGIVVLPGGRLVIDNGTPPTNFAATISSLIEDAVVAIKIENNYFNATSNVLYANNVVFNRNRIGIKISDYNLPLSFNPFIISNCTFTSRSISFPPFNPANNNILAGWWPQNTTTLFPLRAPVGGINNLGNPFISNLNYPQIGTSATLKAPFAGSKPEIGLELVNVGLTQNVGTSTAPIYYEFTIGGLNDMTIFDNQRYGVQLKNSNFKTVNSVFQNSGKGAGIFAFADDDKNNRLQVVPIQTITGGNRFADCATAIITKNYFENNIQYCDVRSNQVNGNAPSCFGFQLNTNRFYAYNIRYNKMYNVSSAVTINTYDGSLNVNGSQVFGQFAGRINVDYNTIQPHLLTATVTTQYIADAINLSNTGNATYLINGAPSVISTNTNWIRACRGIFYTNWKRYNVQCQSNNITVLNTVTGFFGAPQIYYGISVNNSLAATPNSGCFIRQNNVTGFYTPAANAPITGDPNLIGIVSSICSGFTVTCNTTSNTTRGIGFNGGNTNTIFRNNSMQGHRYGFFLDQVGSIGQQGVAPNGSNPLNLADNQWTGTWLSGNFKTATINGSTANLSIMHVRSAVNYNPNGSGINVNAPFSGIYNTAVAPQTLFTYTVPTPPFNLSCLQIIPWPGGFKSMELVVQDSIVANDNLNAFSEKMNYIVKNSIYEILKDDNTFMDSSIVLQDFYNQSLSTVREKINYIQKKLSEGAAVDAALADGDFIASNNIEENYKKYFASRLNKLANNLSVLDSISLKELTEKCPFTDGTVIYEARALYNLIYGKEDVFPDPCNVEMGAKSLAFSEKDTDLDIFLFPNPSQSEVFVKLTDADFSTLSLKVTDANGKIVYSNPSLVVENGLASFHLNVNNGLYLVHLTNTITNEITIKKLVIQK